MGLRVKLEGQRVRKDSLAPAESPARRARLLLTMIAVWVFEIGKLGWGSSCQVGRTRRPLFLLRAFLLSCWPGLGTSSSSGPRSLLSSVLAPRLLLCVCAPYHVRLANRI
jgi:hypothetical protein